MTFTDEEEFYGRVAYEAMSPTFISWDKLRLEVRETYIAGAREVRSAVHPKTLLANKLRAAHDAAFRPGVTYDDAFLEHLWNAGVRP